MFVLTPAGFASQSRVVSQYDNEKQISLTGVSLKKQFPFSTMKKLLMTLMIAGLLSLGAVAVSAQTAPKSVIHVVTVAWKAGTTPEQIKAALAGVRALPAQYKGITRVWIKSIKVQNAQGIPKGTEKTHVFVMEFVDEAALKDYADSPAQKEWYKTYLPIRESSTTFDITN